MTRQNLFYEAAIPISLDRHKSLCVEPGKYQFASQVNSIPLTATEIPHASREYPIVFAGEEKILPIVVLGVESDQNAYISEDGTWSADYVPAFARQYPFVFSLSDDKKTLTLCVDESWAGCNYEGQGQRLFDDEIKQHCFCK